MKDAGRVSRGEEQRVSSGKTVGCRPGGRQARGTDGGQRPGEGFIPCPWAGLVQCPVAAWVPADSEATVRGPMSGPRPGLLAWHAEMGSRVSILHPSLAF